MALADMDNPRATLFFGGFLRSGLITQQTVAIAQVLRARLFGLWQQKYSARDPKSMA